jgi:hypothetical protein
MLWGGGLTGVGGGLGRGGAHAILVVLNHEHARQLPEVRHVDRLEDLTLVRSAWGSGFGVRGSGFGVRVWGFEVGMSGCGVRVSEFG